MLSALIMKPRLFGIVSLLVASFAVAAAQNGTITGTVMDRVSNEPLPSANVLVLGTSLGASTDPDGNFTIREVPVGTYQVRATLVGYEPVILADIKALADLVAKMTTPDEPELPKKAARKP